ncbi:hypothetical protein NDU88_005438 [Pleurodeles waltl]|uniref:Chromosome partitioning protein ParB n=1 Tax=Pleurodeles waltl TaxID=8319 RepID=A0AAV7SLP9_PLEWA|nr:hypothetical protein NDU88_005438 [Pleurodeles waltl]
MKNITALAKGKEAPAKTNSERGNTAIERAAPQPRALNTLLMSREESLEDPLLRPLQGTRQGQVGVMAHLVDALKV